MNILIASISILQEKMQKISYSISSENGDYEFQACHTNESVLQGVNYVLENTTIDRIIALCSNASLEKRVALADNATAVEYYTNVAYELFGENLDFRIINIEILANQERPTGEIMQEICNLINSGDNVYLDIAGGQRTTTNIIQLLTKILKYKGINNPNSYYSNIQRNPDGRIEKGSIENNSDFSRLTDIADGINEFVTTGKATQLRSIYRNPDNKAVAQLIEAMNEFSEKVQLGDLENIDNVVRSLSDSIVSVENIDATDIEYVVLKQMLPVIKEKILGDSESVDYPRIVRWCIENELIQQALTIFVEKIPVFLFDKGFITYDGDVARYKNDYKEKAKGNPLMSADWQTSTFFTEIISPDSVSSDQSDVMELKLCLESGNVSKNIKVQDCLKCIKSFDNPNMNSSYCTREANQIRKWIDEKRFSTYKAFVNYLKNNHTWMSILLDPYSLDKPITNDHNKTISNKFLFVDALRKLNLKRKGPFLFNVDNMDSIMYGYLYAKSVRNLINHASSEEKLNDEQKEVLKGYGYIFDKYDLMTVSHNIDTALKSIENAAIQTVPDVQIPEEDKGSDDLFKLKPQDKVIEGSNSTLKVIGKIDVDAINAKYETKKKKLKNNRLVNPIK